MGISPMVTVCSLEEEGKKFGVRLTQLLMCCYSFVCCLHCIVQTVSHLVNECTVSEFHDGGLQRVHYADYVAVNWLEGMAMKALAI